WLYPDQVQTVYVEMFDTTSFRRGHEFVLTDAICKRLEAQTPYKIVSDRNIADSVLSGQLGIRSSVLATDRYSAKPIEQETLVNVRVTWKDLKTGRLLIDGEKVYASSSYSQPLGQTFDYSIDRAVNKVAVRVVELMETPW
ncbi:MAG: LPS assembly lipoprotein LptE, partial [Planctomycetota bacterium]